MVCYPLGWKFHTDSEHLGDVDRGVYQKRKSRPLQLGMGSFASPLRISIVYLWDTGGRFIKGDFAITVNMQIANGGTVPFHK